MSPEIACGRLRVAVVTETYPPEINGVANTLGYLVRGLVARGHQVDVVRPRQPGDRWESGGPETLVPGVPIPGYRGLRIGLPVTRRLRRLWAATRPDICYIATQGPLGHSALNAAKGLGLPAITGFHTQFHQYSRHYGLGALGQPIMRMLRRFHNRSDRTLVPTAQLRDELTALGFLRVRLFSRGVDTDLFSPRRRSTALRQAWGCDEPDIAVLYVGRLASEKNLALAIQAFEAISATQPSARFVLVGDGPELARLRRAHPHFIFTGAKTGLELAEHYASGDLFLFPSLTETFGNVVPEAMASGLPVVAFDYAAAGSHIRDQENGFKVPAGDTTGFVRKAQEIVAARQRLLTVASEARLTAEGLSWERVLSAFEVALVEVLHERNPGAGSEGAAAAST
jgi:glycosyltransferase involved in cell wall biosynthesis